MPSIALVILLVLLLIGALPMWPYSRHWGYGPASGMGLIVAVVAALVLLGEV